MPPKYIDLDFENFKPEEIEVTNTAPTLSHAIRIFENIQSHIRERLAITSHASIIASTTTPGSPMPMSGDAIRKALVNKKVTAGLQPYRKTSDKNLKSTNPLLADMIGCEALMKIIKDAETLRRAGDIIETTRKIPGLTSQIDLAVLENASIIILIINQLRDNIGLPPIPIAFNCSQDLANRESFAEDVLAVLDEANTPHEFCTIEILEDIHDLDEKQIAELKKLADAGVHIAIDDFDQRINGGEANDPILEKLQKAKIPILRLKIDGRTTHTITRHEGNAKIEKIINIAIENDIKSIVFEGGYDNLTTVTIEHIKSFERKYGDKIEFIVEGTVVDAVATRQP